MRQITFYLATVFLLCVSGVAADKNFHSFTVKTIDDKEQSLSEYKGKVVCHFLKDCRSNGASRALVSMNQA